MQEEIFLKNPFETDLFIKSYLEKKVPKEFKDKWKKELSSFGERVINEVLPAALEAARSEPRLLATNVFGEPVNQIQVSCGWDELKKISAQEGLIAIGYERQFKEYSRVFQFLKQYLFASYSSVYFCPLAMTDGAARLMETFGQGEEKKEALSHLLSRDPKVFWTSGQWMTEKQGGSDVSETSTIAFKDGKSFLLSGEKFFSSATTSEMAITLARVTDRKNKSVPGGKGLSVFYLKTHESKNKLNGIKINKLKDKLGTRSLPTAELTLINTHAVMIGEEGRGVPTIATLFNITRIYNAIACISSMARALFLVKTYSVQRRAFGKKISEHPLHEKTIQELEYESAGAFYLVLKGAELLGKEECKKSSELEKKLLRILTPLMKLYTAKQNISLLSEAIECFGGPGYMEDFPLAQLYRDAQAYSIWEGTTNVLALDVIRSIEKEKSFEGVDEFLQPLFKAKGFEEIKNNFTSLRKRLHEKNIQREADARHLCFALTEVIVLNVLYSENSLKNEQLLSYWKKKALMSFCRLN